MAWTLVQTATPVLYTSGLIGSISYNGPTTSGNLLVLVIATEGDVGIATVTPTTGSAVANILYNTATGSGSSPDVGTYCVIAGSSSVTWNVVLNGGAVWSLQAYEFSNNSSVPFDQASTWNLSVTVGTGGSSSVVTPSNAGELAIAVLASANGGAGTVTWGGGYSELNSVVNGTGNIYQVDVAYQALSGTPATTATATWVNDVQWGLAQQFFIAASVSSTIDAGHLPASGPGISPVKKLQFQASPRSPSIVNNLSGYSASFSFSYGSAQGLSPNLSGVSYSVSQSYGALSPSGNLVGNSYSVSTSFGPMYNSTVVLGNIPGPGPGISPSSAFQFASPILDTSQFQTVLAKGNSFSFSQSYGKATGALALAGNSYSFSFSYGALQASAIGQMTGNSYSVSTSYGAITGLGLSNISGVSYSVSISYGALQAYILVPDVVGLTLQAAQNLLTALGFTTTSSNVYSTNWPAGDVTQQSPQPGSFANLGSSISLFISIGPFVRSPNANLGYKVTTRIFSLEEMVSREWGPEFRAPDHRIYVWSNNRAFDSTDIGTTGIYQKGTNTS